MLVSVVTPTYNEVENVEPLIRRISEHLAGYEHEIIVVDDRSTDGTAEKVRALQEEFDTVRLIVKDEYLPRGMGASYKQGFPEARGEIIVQMDADLSHPPRHLPDLVEAVENGADMAVGSRYVSQGDRRDPFHRRIFPILGSYLYRYGLSVPVKDFSSGYKAYRKEYVNCITGEALPDGYPYLPASLKQVVDAGAAVKEVPITFEPRNAGESKFAFADVLDNLRIFSRLMLQQYHRPIKFGVVGASGVVVNMGLLYLLTKFAGLYYLFSAVFAIEASILSNFFLNEIWTFADKGRAGVKHFFTRMVKCNAVYLFGVALNLATLWTLTEFAGLYYLLSNFIGILFGFAWNYVANKHWTWAIDTADFRHL